jgi:transposase-like protein
VVAEIETSGDSVSGVARRNGLSPQQLFRWRRQVREAQGRHAAIDRHTRPTKRTTITSCRLTQREPGSGPLY